MFPNFGTWRRIRDIGRRSYFQEFVIRQSMIPHLWFPIGSRLPWRRRNFLFRLIPMAACAEKRRSRYAHSKNFYRDLDNFSTAVAHRTKLRRKILFSGKYFDVDRLIATRETKDGVSLYAYWRWWKILQEIQFVNPCWVFILTNGLSCLLERIVIIWCIGGDSLLTSVRGNRKVISQANVSSECNSCLWSIKQHM